MQVFLFTAPSASVLLRTWGYAGGTNINGSLIAQGGFDPILSLYDATGGLLPTSAFIIDNNDGPGVAADSVTGLTSDSLLLLTTLTAGNTYALVLTQNDNSSAGPTYGDGFTRTGQGNFTSSTFSCSGSDPFCDAAPSYRNGNWAVDISGVRSATMLGDVAATPEPGSILLLVSGMAGLAMLRRRKQA